MDVRQSLLKNFELHIPLETAYFLRKTLDIGPRDGLLLEHLSKVIYELGHIPQAKPFQQSISAEVNIGSVKAGIPQ